MGSGSGNGETGGRRGGGGRGSGRVGSRGSGVGGVRVRVGGCGWWVWLVFRAWVRVMSQMPRTIQFGPECMHVSAHAS